MTKVTTKTQVKPKSLRKPRLDKRQMSSFAPNRAKNETCGSGHLTTARVCDKCEPQDLCMSQGFMAGCLLLDARIACFYPGSVVFN